MRSGSVDVDPGPFGERPKEGTGAITNHIWYHDPPSVAVPAEEQEKLDGMMDGIMAATPTTIAPVASPVHALFH